MKLNTFTIGVTNSHKEPTKTQDMQYANMFAADIKSSHFNIFFTADEGFKIIKKVIYQLETYDVNTIRSSIPMFLLAEWIKKNTHTRILFSGEGADELYTNPAPNSIPLQTHIQELYKTDVLRVERCLSAFGLEMQLPFLDIDLVKNILQIYPSFKKEKNQLVKWILRKSFEPMFIDMNVTQATLWRAKENKSFLDKEWLTELTGFIEKKITDKEYDANKENYFSPVNKEEYYYQKIHKEFFKN
jgi:asparagine synthase (glutamine-hydrolysing)